VRYCCWASGAFRRSELVALDVADIDETAEGLRITIQRSNTDQEGAGQTIAIVRGSVVYPIEALKAWLAKAKGYRTRLQASYSSVLVFFPLSEQPARFRSLLLGRRRPIRMQTFYDGGERCLGHLAGRDDL
jgi:integrase